LQETLREAEIKETGSVSASVSAAASVKA